MGRFEGQVALVTGAGSGIGAAMAVRLAEESAAVMCADMNEQSAQATASRLEEMGASSGALAFDVSQADAFAQALDTTASRFGRLDVLMNNAGIGGPHPWEDMIRINLSGVFNGLKHACPLMARAGGGAIVNTSSIAGLNALMRPTPIDELPDILEGTSGYVAAKHGVVGLTRQFAVSFGHTGVRVNAVCPGYIVTPMTAPMRESDSGRAFLESLHPAGRLGEAREVAAVAAFLASADASYVTGVALSVDGGYSAR
jgi:NAD(P)-dependent dehydrogenase (short-subunit alcohol dehydrogenase family)